MKKGRPQRIDDENAYRHVGFKACDETLDAIREMELAVPLSTGVRPSKSVALRHFIIEKGRELRAQRLAGERKKGKK